MPRREDLGETYYRPRAMEAYERIAATARDYREAAGRTKLVKQNLVLHAKAEALEWAAYLVRDAARRPHRPDPASYPRRRPSPASRRREP